jgi:pimeloyl-ACP methyl ester carboxylesterase
MPALLAPLLAAALALAALPAAAGLTVASADGTEIPVATTGDGSRLLVWLPSEHGLTAGERDLAARLAQRGFTVWLPELFQARFLPPVPSSLEQLPAQDVAAVLERAAGTGGAVMMLAGERGAPLALEGLVRLRANAPAAAQRIRGAIFLSPNFYRGTPEPGREPEYAAVTGSNPVPVALVQPALSPWYWYVDELKSRLAGNGAPVHVFYLQGVRDRFYFRDDATAAERDAANDLPAVIDSAWKTIETPP